VRRIHASTDQRALHRDSASTRNTTRISMSNPSSLFGAIADCCAETSTNTTQAGRASSPMQMHTSEPSAIAHSACASSPRSCDQPWNAVA
jgi:hypothetical protein